MKRRTHGPQQSVPTERLHQALNGPFIKDAVTVLGLAVGRDKYDRNVLLAKRQLSLKVGPAHPGQPNIQDQTVRPHDNVRREKLFSRAEAPDPESTALEHPRN